MLLFFEQRGEDGRNSKRFFCFVSKRHKWRFNYYVKISRLKTYNNHKCSM